MDVRELIERVLETVNGNQAELARRLGRSETTISRWVNSRTGIDYESALRIARMTGLPPRQVLEGAGLDPDLFPATEPRAINDAEFASLVAHIQTGWLAMDETTRELAGRGTRALFAIQPTTKRVTTRHRDGATNPHPNPRRVLEQHDRLSDDQGLEGGLPTVYPRHNPPFSPFSLTHWLVFFKGLVWAASVHSFAYPAVVN